jgi:Cu/Ag efflux protein CusF
MKTLTISAALVAAAMLIATPAFPQGTKAQKDCQPSAAAKGSAERAPKAKAPEKIEGQVTKVDPKSGTLTVKHPDGSMHEFKGSTETVRDYKPGDQIELTLRAEPC